MTGERRYTRSPRRDQEEYNAHRVDVLLGDAYVYKETIHTHDGSGDQVHVVTQYSKDKKTGNRYEFGDVIFKEISPEVHAVPEFESLEGQKKVSFRRLELEIETLKELSQGPFMVTILDLIRNPETDRIAGIILEKIEGGDLYEAIQKKTFSEEDITKVGYCITRALATLHQSGLLHRDIKPRNILLDKYGVAKLIDFNVVKAQGPDESDIASQVIPEKQERVANTFRDGLTEPGGLYGTLQYMSPEQTTHGRAVGVLSDLYNLGASLYEMRTGEAPFGQFDEKIDQMDAAVFLIPILPSLRNGSEAMLIDEVIMTLLKKKPEQRRNIQLSNGKKFYLDSTEDLAEVFLYIAELHDPHALNRPPYTL